MRPTSPGYQNDAKTTHKKENYRPIPDEHRCKNPQQNISKLHSTIHLKDTPWSSGINSQGCKDGSTATNQSTWYTILLK